MHDSSTLANKHRQIGFLSEWQLYAQTLQGDSWKGDKMDKGKIDKMSGMYIGANAPYMC
jgi:hypothetical protein